MNFIKPKIIISKCLEFDACRYDGQLINNKNIKKLKNYINFIPICPEVEIGMGIPRESVKIIKKGNKDILYQEKTGKDFSLKMNSFSKGYINKIENVDGFIFKSKSPSCGVNSTKIYSNKNHIINKGSGLFSKKIISKFPNHPIEEEQRLNNIFIREYFYTRIFTIADFNKVKNFDTLYKYHGKHKYLFMSYNQTILKKMGNVAANKNNLTIEEVKKEYYKLLLVLFLKKSRYPSNINTHMHVMGYFKKDLTQKEKKHFLDMLEFYRNKKIPISSINNILYSWIIRFENNYLMNQSFFNPFPNELINKEESRFL